MPPVSKAGGSAFRKDVEYVTKDDDEQIAAGVVMVPDKVDLQNDFAREETIRGFAEQFEAFVEAGEAGGGVMHAVFPDGWMDLERNEVLDEATEIGGTEAPAGAWVQEWRIENDDLWELIDDGILGGYSIGAVQVDWDGPYEQDADEVDDVAVPEQIDAEALVWELVDGLIREVSAVDIPAVPDAQILETKADAEKRLGDHLGDQDAFIEEALQRGHSEDEAERLWDVLSAATEVDGSGDPGEKGLFQRIGKAAVDTFLGSDDPDGVAETPESDPRKEGAEKEGRTLSRQNEDDLKAVIDAATSIFRDAGKDPDITRFTDREDDDFDLSEHTAREFAGPEEDEDGETDVSPMNTDPGGDTPDDTDTTDMTDDTPDDNEGEKALAEQNAEQIKELTDAVANLTETIAGPQPKTAEIEIAGESYEVPEDAAKAALGVDEDAGVGVADAIESLKTQVEEQQQRLDTINQQSGVSTQIERDAGTESDDNSGLEGLGKALS